MQNRGVPEGRDACMTCRRNGQSRMRRGKRRAHGNRAHRTPNLTTGMDGLSEVNAAGNENRTGGEVLGSERLIDSVIDEVIDRAVGLGVRSRMQLVLQIERFPLCTGYGIGIDGVRTGLSEFDEFTVGDTGSRP